MRVVSQEVPKLGLGNDSLVKVLQVIKQSKERVDNIVLLSDLMISEGFEDYADNDGSTIDFLKDYVNSVNPDLKIFSVDLKGYGQKPDMSQVFSDKNFIRINGMSNNILKFISVNEQIDQLAYIKKLASEI